MLKINIFFLIGFVILFTGCSCNSTNKKKLTRKKIGNYFVEAHFIDSNKIDGLAKYYDENGSLLSVANYENDLKAGPAINFYSNGMKKDSMFFTGGLRNGEAFIYDSLGHLERMTTYYYGISVGNNILYSSGRLKEYFFNDFNSNTLFSCEYDSSGKCLMGGFGLKPITNIIKDDDGKSVMTLFLYLPKPPNLSTIYHIGLANENNEKKSETIIKDNRLFLDTALYEPGKGLHYYISTHIENANGSTDKMFIHELKW
jgi:hypothetical protein